MTPLHKHLESIYGSSAGTRVFHYIIPSGISCVHSVLNRTEHAGPVKCCFANTSEFICIILDQKSKKLMIRFHITDISIDAQQKDSAQNSGIDGSMTKRGVQKKWRESLKTQLKSMCQILALINVVFALVFLVQPRISL